MGLKKAKTKHWYIFFFTLCNRIFCILSIFAQNIIFSLSKKKELFKKADTKFVDVSLLARVVTPPETVTSSSCYFRRYTRYTSGISLYRKLFSPFLPLHFSSLIMHRFNRIITAANLSVVWILWHQKKRKKKV